MNMLRYLPLFLSIALLGGGCSIISRDQAPPVAPATRQQPAAVGPELDLSGRGLTAIPSYVFSRTDLERLDLSDNRLTGAPQAEIRHLQRLTFLDLSGNDLTGLPAELGQLKQLEILDVSNNRLTGLPLELGNLTQLRIFDISGNLYSKLDLDQISVKLSTTEIRR